MLCAKKSCNISRTVFAHNILFGLLHLVADLAFLEDTAADTRNSVFLCVVNQPVFYCLQQLCCSSSQVAAGQNSMRLVLRGLGSQVDVQE